MIEAPRRARDRGSKAKQYFANYTAAVAQTSNIWNDRAGGDDQSYRPVRTLSDSSAFASSMLFFGALALPGCHKDEAGSAGPAPVVAAPGAVIPIVADERGFTPAAVQTDQGSKLTLRFTRTTDATCADKVVFPEAGIEKELPLKVPVDVVVPTDKARTLGFQCGMGMFKSAVLVK